MTPSSYKGSHYNFICIFIVTSLQYVIDYIFSLFVAMATDGAVKTGVHAGNLIKAVAPIVGGGGGGRPNMAQAGGRLPEKKADAVEAVADEVKKQLGA